MARKKKDPADSRIERSYYRTCDRVTIPMLAIPKIFRDARAAMTPDMTDETLDALMISIVKPIRTGGREL